MSLIYVTMVLKFIFCECSFKSNYPNWEPDGNGKQFMSVLTDFRLRKEENDLAMGHLFSSVRLPNPPNQLRPHGAPRSDSPYIRSVNSSVRDRFGNRIPFNRAYSMSNAGADGIAGTSQARDNYDCPFAENTDQLYWLDKFYTASQSPQSAESGLSMDERHRDGRGLVTDGNIGRNGVTEGGVLSRGGDGDYLSSEVGINMQASSRGILGTQVFEQAAGESRWWARRGPGSTAMPESSFEPPMFRGHMVESQDDFYESEEDHERDWVTQRHTRGGFASSHISEDENPNLEFPFGDVYERPQEGSAVRAEVGVAGTENRAD